MGWRLAVWAASCRIPRTQGEPCLVIWPWRTLRSELRTWGVSPAQAHSLRAVGKRAMSPISATKVIAVSLPTPGRTISAWTRGSGLARVAISPQPGDGGGQGVQQPTAVLDDRPWGWRQGKVGQPGPPRTSPQDL